MNLKAKPYVLDQRAAAMKNLADRKALLKERGSSDESIGKDPQIKKIKADISHADRRLRSIAAQEKLNADRAEEKVKKVEEEKEKKVAERTAGTKAPKKKKKPEEKTGKKGGKKDGKKDGKKAKSKK